MKPQNKKAVKPIDFTALQLFSWRSRVFFRFAKEIAHTQNIFFRFAQENCFAREL